MPILKKQQGEIAQSGGNKRTLWGDIKADFHKEYVPEGMSKEDYDRLQGAYQGAGALSKIGAAPDAMARGIKFIAKKASPVIESVKTAFGNGLLGAATDHIGGLVYGIGDIMTGRKPSEVFPITKAQKAAIMSAQDAAAAQGETFVKDWFYGPNKKLRPQVRDKIKNTFDDGAPGFRFTDLGEPGNELGQLQTILYKNNRAAIRNNVDLWPYAQNYAINERGKFAGVSFGNTNLIPRNQGLYYRRPQDIADVAAHEAGHTAQQIGNTESTFGQNLADISSKSGYYSANLDTQIGRTFGEHMRKPSKVLGWFASPNELHSELMVARKNAVDKYITAGMPKEDAINKVMNATESELTALRKERPMGPFFKFGTKSADKNTLLRYLPGVGVATAVGSTASQSNDSGLLKR